MTGISPNRRLRVVMLVENSYPQDVRVRNEATLLASVGHEVTVVALRRGGQPRTETLDGVRVYRMPRLELFKKTARTDGMSRFVLKVKSALGYRAEYAYFTSASFAMSVVVLCRHGFDVLHAHNPPDTLFLVALPFKLIGKKFVFDHHDLC